MKSMKINSSSHLLRLEKDEMVVSSIVKYCNDKKILSGRVVGLGAVSSADLALYELDKKEYHKKRINGPLEIANLTGFIAVLDGEAKTHLHMIVSDIEMHTFGGHLDEACVAATCEVLITDFDHKIERKFNEEIGLNLLDI